MFFIVTVQYWSKNSSTKTVRPLRTLKFSNVIDIDVFSVKKPKINSAFLIFNE